MKNENMNLIERIQAPTPKWFRTLRSIGLILAAVGGAIIAAPVSLPASLISAAGYLVLGGGIISAVSQTAILPESSTEKNEKQIETK